MTTNFFFIPNVKQLRTHCSFRILLNFFRTYWDIGILNSAIFNNFHNRVEFDTRFLGPSEFRRVECLNTTTQTPLPPRYATILKLLELKYL